MREQTTSRALTGISLRDVRDGSPVDLGALPGRFVLTLIRHRF